MTAAMLTKALAELAMGWRAGKGRFLTGAREWITDSQFQPLSRIEDAFKLLRKVACEYSLTRTAEGISTATVVVGRRAGVASGESEPMTVALALARALGLDVEEVD
jgi:hypothetical protein